jgi:hypothetical protein
MNQDLAIHRDPQEPEDFLDEVRRLASEESVDWNSPEAIPQARIDEMLEELRARNPRVETSYDRGVQHNIEGDNDKPFFDFIKPFRATSSGTTAYYLSTAKYSIGKETLENAVRIQKIIDAWYIAFNQALNIPDQNQRLEQMRTSMQNLRRMNISEKIGGADSVVLHGALSILLNKNPEIGTLARSRAMEAAAEIVDVAQIPKDESFLTIRALIHERLEIGKDSGGRRVEEYLPTSATAEEVKKLLNEHIPGALTMWAQGLDRRFIPTMLARYPEATVRTLLALLISSHGDIAKYALEGIASIGKIPDTKKAAVFGAAADYKELCLAPGQRVAAEIGATTSASLEEQLKNLGPDQLVKAVIMLLHENDILADMLFERERESATRFRRTREAEYQNFDPKNYYSILEINPETMTDMNDEQVELTLKRHYRKLMQIHHPDKNPDRKEESHKMTQDILEAYTFLKDPDNRRSYGRR